MNCVFCGKIPAHKTREHVLPQWLFAMTGDSRRKLAFGMNYETGKPTQFSANAFQFPACDICNSLWSGPEGDIKRVVTRLIDDKEIVADDITRLLDWMDKVRVGCWLGFNHLNAKALQISPHYGIDKRVGAADRWIGVFVVDGDSADLGLILGGLQTKLALMYPACFVLRINKLIIISGSAPYFLARGGGLPYGVNPQLTGDMSTHERDLRAGTETLDGSIFDTLPYSDTILKIGQVSLVPEASLNRWQQDRSRVCKGVSKPIVQKPGGGGTRYILNGQEIISVPTVVGPVELHIRAQTVLVLAWQVKLVSRFKHLYKGAQKQILESVIRENLDLACDLMKKLK